MKIKPYYDDVLTEEFFMTNYIEKRLSFPKLKELLDEQGHNIAIGTIYKYSKKLGLKTRDQSEARREWDDDPMNYNISYLSENVIELIDGFLLGDGCIRINKINIIKTGRLTCGVEYEEFCKYFSNIFKIYKMCAKSTKHKKMKSGILWYSYSKFHPDLYLQYQRWYKYRDGKFIKSVPTDVRITPISVMMWYLGDGSLVTSEDNSTVMLRLSTDGFTKDEVEYLVIKLKELGIECHRNNDNRIMVNSKGIPAFFDFIGYTSPVNCYNHKFDLPEWRFKSKRMSEVCEELGVDYNRLSHLVKIGSIETFRLTPKGRPRFLPSHINKCRELMQSGELY